MDVGATSLNKGTEQAVASSGNSSAGVEANVQVISNSLQESVATSRLSSLLSSLVEPLAAAPRMPQLRGPRNTSEEEKASLPQQPVATPSFPIPPHVMGRNIDNPVEDLVAHGRRLQKPRLGVRVPYRNLTSQIVTQDELAQELLERSLKKHPVHDIPEGGDLFFAIKLTQRLANRLTPSTAQGTSPSASQAENMPGRSQSTQQPSADSNCVLAPDYVASESTAIPDHSDLLAILEGDVDPDWAPSPKPPETNINVVQVPPPLPHITNAKLDPLLEKELALKQLMEFQTHSRRRKSDKNQKPTEKSRKPKPQAKKPPINKENGVSEQADSQNNNTPSGETKQAKKRKLPSTTPDASKKPRLSGKKNSPPVRVEPKVIAIDDKKKTDAKVPKKSRVSKNGIQSSAVNSADVKRNTNSEVVTKPKNVKNLNVSGKTGSAAGKKKSDSPQAPNSNTSNIKQETNLNASSNNSSTLSTSIIDGLPEFPRTFPTPLRTYSPKKRIPNTNTSPKVQSPEVSKNKEDKTAAQETNVSTANVENNSKTPPASSPGPSSNTASPSRKKKDVKDIKDTDSNKSKRRMGEVDRLLMDEGAINLLYEAEHGESKRRTSLLEESENTSTNQRRILKSVRRKKKDLLLKTRLVKNAVMRLSNSPSTSSLSVASRTKRRADVSAPQSPDSQSGLPHRKLSLDSQDSLRSPPPLTPDDFLQSPQTFVYPTRLPLPAEASRIIRRHSSSSNFSSRSASPNNIRVGDSSQNIENDEKRSEAQKDSATGDAGKNSAKTGGQAAEGRKKGVPIFIRKPVVTQTYRGKRKKDGTPEVRNSGPQVLVKTTNKVPESTNKEAKANTKLQSESAQKSGAQKKKEISLTDKFKLKAEMSKNFQKGFQTAKLKPKNADANLKKKQDASKEKSHKPDSIRESGTQNDRPVAEETPDLSSCLAAAASAFAAEAREERVPKKTVGSNGTSHTSSPCPSRSSKSPTPTSKPPVKKATAPLSPNAATYSNLLKTLENDSQKPRKKDGEEATKQRSSVRQNAGTYHYKDISLRRYDNLVQIILTPQSTKMKNAMNLQVLRELRDALHQLKKDETCRAVLLTSTGSSFCQGVDFYGLLQTNTERRKVAAQELAQALKEFLKSLALFSKPIVAGVHGAAVGLGVTMLPFFDMVFASDKATFYTPYAKLGQVPEGGAILTLPHMFGNAVTSELLFGCRKLTANEALHFGLVTRILWPDRFQEELIPVIRSMANQSSQSMEATKALLRHSLRTKLDAALESETHLLVQHWTSAECQANFKRFLDDEDVGLQRQRVEA